MTEIRSEGCFTGCDSDPRHKQLVFFFFNDTATTEIYTLSLHDALPIYSSIAEEHMAVRTRAGLFDVSHMGEIEIAGKDARSEEHTSELQSQSNLVCRLLLEKKKTATKSRSCLPKITHTRKRTSLGLPS